MKGPGNPSNPLREGKTEANIKVLEEGRPRPSPPPSPPLSRRIKEGCSVFCNVCGSTKSMKYVIFGTRSCDQPLCPTNKELSMTELTLVPKDEPILPVEIVAILDRSGSMRSILDDAIGGFNTFIEGQKSEEGEARITVALFDDQYELLQDGANLTDAVVLDHKNFVPRGMTALYDAIGKTVSRLKERRVNGEIDGAIITILTDGHENASTEYTRASIKELITECETNYGWTFIYLAANQDAFAIGGSLGISAGNAMNFTASAAGTETVFKDMGGYTRSYRTNYLNRNAGPLLDDGKDEQ